MIKIERLKMWEDCFEDAIMGMRNSMNSWDGSDSHWDYIDYEVPKYIIGPNDMSLMKRLYKAGSEQRKFMRQLPIIGTVNAPLYWWKEMDQYRINVTSNSCSTMHKIAAKEFTLDDFSHEHLSEHSEDQLNATINTLNAYRILYLDTKDKFYWWQMIQLLPSSYNQKRTISMNYENAANIIRQRTGHKLDEWHTFVAEMRKLPYLEEIMDEKD